MTQVLSSKLLVVSLWTDFTKAGVKRLKETSKRGVERSNAARAVDDASRLILVVGRCGASGPSQPTQPTGLARLFCHKRDRPFVVAIS